MADWSNNLDDAFAEWERRIDERAPAAIAKGLEYLRAVVDPKVPRQSGHLAGEADVTAFGATGDGAVASGELYYPGPYALYQHEGVYYRHGKFGAPLRHIHGESFFLESSVAAEGQNVIRVIGDALLGDG